MPTLRAQQVLTRDSASLVDVALQRCEGWRECRTPPLGDPCDLSWSFAALRGLVPGGPGRLWVSVRPVRRFDALRVVILRTSSRPEGRGSAPRALSCSYRDMSLQPRTATSLRTALASRRKTRLAMQPLLGFGALRHSPGPADPPELTTDPSVTACRVRGLGTPFATSTTDPPGAQSAGASMGLTLQGVLLVRERCPFRGPYPPDVAGRARSPRGERTEPTAFRALFPRRVRAVTSLPKETGRRCLPGLRLSRVCSPSARAIACSHDAGPLVLRGDDVPTRLDLRASRIEWIGLARFRAAYSLEVSHLATVAALRSPSRGAGLLFHLTQDAARYTRHLLRSKLPRGRCSREILGPRPGATVHRCSTGHLVRSSALVFS